MSRPKKTPTWVAAASAMWLSMACAPLKEDSGDPDADAGTRKDADEISDESTGPGRAGASANAGAGGSGGSTDMDDQGPSDGSLECRRGLPTTVTREVSGTQSGSIEWSGVVHVTGDFSLRGAGSKLTIAPGTQVFVDPERMIEIGWNSSEHTIEAQGTEAAPIKFCRTSASGLPWRGLVVGTDVHPNSALRYVVLEGAGAGEEGAALSLGSAVLLDHVWVRDSAGDGVRAADFRDGSAELHVTSSAGAPLVLDDAGAVQRLPEGDFAGNTEDVARLTFDVVRIGVRFRDVGVPYELEAGLSLRQDGALTVDPGVEWRVGVDELVELGWNSSQVEVHLDGTEAEPIVIRGVEARPGSWRGLVVQTNVVSTSTFEFVHVLHGGGMEGAGLTFAAAVNASDLQLRDNAHVGFAIGERGLQPGSARFTVRGTKGVPGVVEPDALTTLPDGGDYTGNDDDYLEVAGGNIRRTGTIPEVGVPFRVMETVTVRGGAMLEIEPGVVFEMQSGVTWDVGWNANMATLTAVGTADKPIRFRGIQDSTGFWNGISIGRNVATSSRLEYVEIGNAGADAALGGNLRLNAPITVSNCTLYDSARYGLVVPMEYTQPYETLNTFEGNLLGDVQRK